jgi:hemolysin activation/secretion protein
LRPSFFVDYGERYLLDPPPSRRSTERMLGTGLGFYVTAGEHFDARFTVGWAVLGTPGTHAGQARGYFSVGYQF